MQRAKELIWKIFHPPILVTILVVLIAAAGLIFTFMTDRNDSVFGYVSYAASAYALAIAITTLKPFTWPEKGRALLQENAYGRRYMNDYAFRVQVSLSGSLSVNSIYALFTLGTAIYSRSFWFGAITIYYIILCVARFFLLRHLRLDDEREAWRKYRFCGYLLIILNIALTGVLYQMVRQGQAYTYPGILIYAMAAYAFYILTISIINVAKYRKLHNPILSAAKALNLATALFSMLTLESAMFTAFNEDIALQYIMSTITSACIWGIILVMAVYMVRKANRNLKQQPVR